MLHDYEIRAEFQENYRYAHDFWAPFIQDAQVYTLSAAGYTWSEKEREELIKEGREPIEFNIQRRPLQFFSGYLRDNVNQIVYGPREGSDEETCDQFTDLGYDFWGKNLSKFLDGADECIKSGISLIGIEMNYSKDFINGDPCLFYRTFNSFYLDPTFQDISLNDCGFAITRDLIGRDAIKLLVPFIPVQDIDELTTGFRDDKFLSYMPQMTTTSKNRNLIAYDQYYRRTTRTRKYLVDRKSSYARDITDFPKEEKDKLKIGLKRLSELRRDSQENGFYPEDVPDVIIMDREAPYIELNIMINGERLYTGEDKTGLVETYPFAPAICYMEPSIWMPSLRIQGISSTNYSLQRSFNKRHMKIMDMMDSDIATGFMYLIGSVPDPTDMQQSGQNKIIGVDPENAPQGLDSVRQLQGGSANPSLIQYQQILDQLSLTLANVNESTLGIDKEGNTQISGRLAEVRIAQGLRTNRKMFDNIEQTQLILGEKLLTVFQKNYPPEKIERILNKKPTQQFYDKEFDQYDVVVKEGIRSKSQRDAYYYELVNLKREGIVDVPQTEIISALAMTGLTDLKKAIEEQQQQQAEQQKKVNEQELMSLQLANAQKEQMLALAQERRARVVADLSLSSERASEAEENRAQAALARARTITEISKMELDKIMQVLDFVNMLEVQETQDRESVESKIQSQANQINSETQGSSENMQQQSMQMASNPQGGLNVQE